jgi:hypothetical protein
MREIIAISMIVISAIVLIVTLCACFIEELFDFFGIPYKTLAIIIAIAFCTCGFSVSAFAWDEDYH